MFVNQKINQTPCFELWSDAQLDMLHNASLEILERTGVVVHDERALKLLKDAGARVNGNVAKIPAHLVEEAIRSAPPKVTFANTKGERVINLCKNNVYFGLGTDLPAFSDPHTSEIRSTLLSDIVRVGKVAQACEHIDFAANLGVATDIEDQRLIDLYSYKALRTYCDKPVWATSVDAVTLKALIDMAAIEAGGYDNLRENPTIGLYNEPISPLVYSREAIQKLMLCAEYGIPSTWASGITMGSTGPATLAGCMALGNAEGLGGLVIHQLVKKGAPFIYGIVFSSLDMMTTTSPYASQEAALGHMIAAQMGRRYDIPSYGTGGVTDSNTMDTQAGIDAMFTNFTNAIGGANFIHDNGYMGAGLVGSLEMIVLDDELARFIKYFMRSAPINEETLCLDVIHEVGHGGEYISQYHTFENFKTHIYSPKYVNKKLYQTWKDEGARPLSATLSARVMAILDSDMPVLLTKDTAAAFDAIIEKTKSALL